MKKVFLIIIYVISIFWISNFKKITVLATTSVTLRSETGFAINNGLLTGIEAERTVSDFDLGLDTKYTTVILGKNNKTKTTGYIFTGDIIQIKNNNEIVSSPKVVIKGDVNSDGKISPLDYVVIKNHIMQSTLISGDEYLSAADFDNDGNIKPLDYVKVKNYIMDRSSEKYTIKYNANGGSGSVSSQQVVKNETTNVRRNKFTKSESNFVSWNTKSDGTGTTYKEVSKIKVTNNITLYAQWKVITYKVTFNINGGSGTTPSVVNAKNGSAMPTITSTLPTRSDYTFIGWYDNSDYTKGTQYYTNKNKSAKNFDKKSDITLYAGWKKEVETYTIKYYCDFTNLSESPFATQTVSYGSKITIKKNTCSNNTTKYPAKWRDPAGGVWTEGKEYTWKYNKGQWGINESNILVLTSVPNYMVYDSYDSSTLKYWIEKHGTEKNREANKNYIVTHIWVQDAYNQLKMAITPKKESTQALEYPRELLVPRKIMEKEIVGLETKGLVAINSSPMIDEGGTWCSKCPKEWSGTGIISLKIHNGKIIRDSTMDETNVGTTSSNKIYMLGQNGYLTYYTFYAGTSSNFSKNESNRNTIVNTIKPKYTFGFKPVLVWKGTNQLNNDNCTSDFCKKTNIRQSICQIDKNDFIFITTLSDDVNSRSGGLTLPALADLMIKYNCQTGFNLDGGGSTGYFYKKNTSTLNGVPGTYYYYRPNVEMLYFVEK